MAHECMECGSTCYCDMDDCWFEAPLDCRHVCPLEDEVDEYGDDDEDESPRPVPGGAAAGEGER